MDNSFYGQLNVFQTIAQEGSISAAARKLEIAVPSASQALKLLEQKIGVPLFHRTTRNIQLTDVGRQLLERTEQAMATLHQAFEEVQAAFCVSASWKLSFLTEILLKLYFQTTSTRSASTINLNTFECPRRLE